MPRSTSTNWGWPADRIVFPVSIKGVPLPSVDNVVLLLNKRGERELPGGRLEIGETPEQGVVREIREELQVEVRVDSLLDTPLFEVVPGKLVATCGCLLGGGFIPAVSNEHRRFGVFAHADRPRTLPVGYRASIETGGNGPQADIGI